MTGPRARRRHELEFLPGALEIQESSPSPLGRAVAGVIVFLFVVAALWASIGSVDVVAVARGKLIPSDRSKVVQPLEGGIVRAIHVRDGQQVSAGAALIELDPTATAAEHQRLVKEHLAALVQVARLTALLAGRSTLEAPPLAGAGAVALQQQLLRDQWAEHQSRAEAARLLVAQREASAAATQAEVEGLEATVPMLAERAEAFRRLLAGGFVARIQYLEVEEQRIARVQALAALRERLTRDLAALAEAEKHRQALAAEFRRARLAELAEWETRAGSLAEEVIKASQRSRVQRLRAPIDGVVQQLAVHTVGGVVTPAQQLMVLVPRDDPLEVEAWVENKDAGFIHPGQPVEVKIDTFPFTRYGTVAGRVLTVSGDAIQVDRVGLVYAVRASLERPAIQMDGRPVSLRPGMAVTVEVRTGQRRLIEFFLSPLLRSGREAFRER